MAVDKPEGWTSHDVVALARGVLGIRQVGHGGTLDPLASGLLPLLVGRATKFAARLHEAPKVYDALVRFGAETATDDREGEPVRRAPVPDPAAIETGLAGFRGVIQQVPPAYAAVKVKGRPAYARARAGEVLTLQARTVQVQRLDVIATAAPDLRLLVVCSSGTYIRSLARDLGRALDSAAHLAGLRRLAVGSLEASSAVRADRLREQGRDAALAALREASDDLLRLDVRFLTSSTSSIVGARESA